MRKGSWWLILATLLWSGNYVAGRFLAHQIAPLTLNAIRWVVSALILAVMLRVSGRRIPWHHYQPLLILGFLGMFAFSSLTYIGLTTVPAAQAGMISGTIPVLIMIASVILLGAHPKPLGWVGVALSVVGVSVMVGSQTTQQMHVSQGDFELIGAAVAWSLYTVLARKWSTSMDPLTLTTGSAIAGAFFSIVAAFLIDKPLSAHLTAPGIFAVVYVSTAASVIAYVVWTTGVANVGAPSAAPFMNLLPVWTVILGVTLLKESISTTQILGGTMAVCGALLSGRPTRTTKTLAS